MSKNRKFSLICFIIENVKDRLKKILTMSKTNKELIFLGQHYPKQLSVIMEIVSAWSHMVAIWRSMWLLSI